MHTPYIHSFYVFIKKYSSFFLLVLCVLDLFSSQGFAAQPSKSREKGAATTQETIKSADGRVTLLRTCNRDKFCPRYEWRYRTGLVLVRTCTAAAQGTCSFSYAKKGGELKVLASAVPVSDDAERTIIEHPTFLELTLGAKGQVKTYFLDAVHGAVSYPNFIAVDTKRRCVAYLRGDLVFHPLFADRYSLRLAPSELELDPISPKLTGHFAADGSFIMQNTSFTGRISEKKIPVPCQ